MSVSALELVSLMAIVATAYCVEAATGFGSTVVGLTLGAAHFGLDPLLAVLVPLNLMLSTWILLRAREHISRPFLLQRALPAMGLGLLIGSLLTQSLPARAMALGFGLFVAGLAAWQLLSLARPPAPIGPPDSLARLASPGSRPRTPRLLRNLDSSTSQWATLLAGGVAHGLFGTGGPLAVIVAQRAVPDKVAFRATLACLWLVLNVGVLARLGVNGALGVETLILSGALLLPLALGALAGDRLHRVLSREAFRVIVATVLLFGGAALAWSHR